MDLGEARGFLIARVHWTPDSSKLAIERMNRVQNQLDLLLADVLTGTARTILHESDPYWININDLFRFLPDGQFIWGSERDGFRHLYLYSDRTASSASGSRKETGRWRASAGIDESRKTLYFVSSEASPLERQLYSIKLNGKDRVRISQGAGTHSISMSPTTEYYMDTFSSVTEPPRKTLHNAAGAETAVYREANHKLTG